MTPARYSDHTVLRFADDFTVPLDAVTETFAILAKRRAGKSNAAVVMAEEMYAAGLPWVAVDPKGDWWGCVPKAMTAQLLGCRWSCSVACTTIAEKLSSARDNNRFLDRRLAELESMLVDHTERPKVD